MLPYTESFDNSHKTLRLIPQGPKGTYEWAPVSDRIREKMGEGITNFELDISRLHFIDSLALGLIVSYNAMTEGAGGSFRLVVTRNSSAQKIVQTTKLHMLLRVIEIDPQ